MKVRIKFTKLEHLRYVGHLDMMRYFQKAFRRAKVDIAYSEGYSPHQLISFAAPLGLGMTSEAEYMDAVFNSVTTSEQMIQKINEQMVPQVKVLSFVELPEDAKKAMSVTAAADYEITINTKYYNEEKLLSYVLPFYDQNQIMICKKSKKSEKIINIKPFIYEIKLENNKIFMKTDAGSSNYISPELVLQALCEFTKNEYHKTGFHIHKKEMYLRNEKDGTNEFCPLDSIGKIIGE